MVKLMVVISHFVLQPPEDFSDAVWRTVEKKAVELNGYMVTIETGIHDICNMLTFRKVRPKLKAMWVSDTQVILDRLVNQYLSQKQKS